MANWSYYPIRQPKRLPGTKSAMLAAGFRCYRFSQSSRRVEENRFLPEAGELR